MPSASQSAKEPFAAGIPEFEFLCACCRPAADTSDLAQCLKSTLDWEHTLKLAAHHRVLPAVHAGMQHRMDAPASIQSALHSRFSNHRLKILRFSAELVSVLRQFEKHGIKALAHKGPVLAQQLFGDPAMRDFGDLDFLVRPVDVARARTALRELGYAPALTMSPRQEQEYLRTGYEYVFGSAAEPNLIELQWQIVPRFYSIPFSMELLFQRSVVREFEGMPLRTFCNEDLMLVLCVHAAKHGWSQLGMVRDITALARLELDWRRTASDSRRLGIQRIVAVSLELARTMLGLDLPQDFAFNRAPLGQEGRAADIRDGMRRAQEPALDSIHYFRSMMDLRERWQDRTRFAWRLAFTPSVGEWQAATLAGPLFPLYRFVRIGRLAKRGWRKVTSKFQKPDRE